MSRRGSRSLTTFSTSFILETHHTAREHNRRPCACVPSSCPMGAACAAVCVVLFMAERVHLCSSEWAARINCSQQSYWTLLVNRERFWIGQLIDSLLHKNSLIGWNICFATPQSVWKSQEAQPFCDTCGQRVAYKVNKKPFSENEVWGDVVKKLLRWQ